MDTDNLRLFVLAADKLNISAAGKTLGLAPAVASARLAKLEREMGADLLHRTTRKVSLSIEGAEFLPFAREILEQENAARAALGIGTATPSGVLRFAAPSSFAQLYIAPIVPEFLRAYPTINLDLRLSDAPFDPIEGSFDLSLRNAAIEDTSLKGRKLADDTRILCAAPSYLADHGTPQTVEDLDRHSLVAFREKTAKRLIGRQGETGSFDARNALGRLTVDDGLSQRLATRAGAGISVNSLWSVHEDLCSGALVRVLPDYQVEDRAALWLVYPKSNVLSPKVRVFIDFLLEKIGRAPPWLGT
ncbi:MAG: LysR family transcriptional regulator [Pseudomonadota bacterium]